MKLLDRCFRYIEESLGFSGSSFRAWEGAKRLPFFLSSIYEFYEARLLSVDCLLVVCPGGNLPTPLKLQKQRDLLRELWPGEVVFVLGSLLSHNRKRLISRQISFVVPDSQLYLPFLAVDLRERAPVVTNELLKFSPSTQALFLYALKTGVGKEWTATALEKELGYSRMTLSRAFRELETAGVAQRDTVKQREKVLAFRLVGRALWDKALPFLSDPVKKHFWVIDSGTGELGSTAGLTALATWSDLVSPANPVYAVGQKDWKRLKGERGLVPLSERSDDYPEVQIWSYPPGMLSFGGTVDRLSLYLSLRDTTNERVEMALEKMMEGFEW